MLTLAEATRQKKVARALVQAQREQSARIAGELEAAKRIQTATLPRHEFLRGDARIDLAATMIPAREVGGDLYDFFRLDDAGCSCWSATSPARAVGEHFHGGQQGAVQEHDAAGTRTPTSASSCRRQRRSLARQPGNAVCHRVRGASWIWKPANSTTAMPARKPVRAASGAAARLRRIEDGDGPPLCAVRRLRLPRRRTISMRPGEMLCVITDGVTEAQNAAGSSTAASGCRTCLLELHAARGNGARRCGALRTDVEAFAAGAEPADDVTILVLRWRGATARLSARPSCLRRLDALECVRRLGVRQRTKISTRRLRGSDTPSAVGTTGSRLPRPMAAMFSGAMPRSISAARTVSARWRESASLT